MTAKRAQVALYLCVAAAAVSCLLAPDCRAADVVVVGDTHLKPVVDIVAGLRKTMRGSLRIYAPAEARGTLKRITEREEAKVVVALGKEALAEALQLPPAIPVIYDLAVIPPVITRPNTTGFYMATPVREYTEFLKNHLHAIQKIAVIGSRSQLKVLAGDAAPEVASYSVKSSFELVDMLKQLDAADAILLLPDVSLLTATAMEQAYLLSFRNSIPLLGISEQHVKEGALLALVVNMTNVGRLIGEYADKAMRGLNIGQFPPSPPRAFDLFVNTDTARKMGIHIPKETLRIAKRAYP